MLISERREKTLTHGGKSLCPAVLHQRLPPLAGSPTSSKHDKYRKIMEKKISIPVEELCRGLPSEFSNYLNYVKSLRFEDRPDYGYLRRMLKELLITKN
mmetsp:Transcript_17800/g.32173  ORF Transcript_17800/g.32173 Transcript_17800/m.32173 type:complete len:99 (+) Transcript_17800:328-624(+)